MSIIERPNAEALYRALNIYRDTMRPFIIKCMPVTPGISTEAQINEALPALFQDSFSRELGEHGSNPIGVMDIKHFGYIISHYWSPYFNQRFNCKINRISASLREIEKARNLIAHPNDRDIESKATQNYLHKIASSLKSIDAEEEADQVEEIISDLNHSQQFEPADEHSRAEAPSGIAGCHGHEYNGEVENELILDLLLAMERQTHKLDELSRILKETQQLIRRHG